MAEAAKIPGAMAAVKSSAKKIQPLLDSWKLDVVIANDVSQADIGFNSDINGVTWLDDTGHDVMPLTTKQNLAKLLIERCRQKLSQPEDQNKHMSAQAEDNR